MYIDKKLIAAPYLYFLFPSHVEIQLFSRASRRELELDGFVMLH